MDYTRPNHVPSADELAAQARAENRWLAVFAAVLAVVVVGLALVFGSHIG